MEPKVMEVDANQMMFLYVNGLMSRFHVSFLWMFLTQSWFSGKWVPPRPVSFRVTFHWTMIYGEEGPWDEDGHEIHEPINQATRWKAMKGRCVSWLGFRSVDIYFETTKLSERVGWSFQCFTSGLFPISCRSGIVLPKKRLNPTKTTA